MLLLITRFNLRKSVFKVLVFLCFLFMFACSTDKDAFVNRSYHGMTAKYNGYFNANELINNSLSTYKTNFKEDYYSILPVEIFPLQQDIPSILPAVDTAIIKCMKVVRAHSMPSFENGQSKKIEYNPWMDENWMTIGQCYFYKQDYEVALKDFRYVKRLFEKDKSTYHASIWLIKTQLRLSNLDDAEYQIKELDKVLGLQLKEKEDRKKTPKRFFSVFKKGSKKDEKLPVFSRKQEGHFMMVKGSYFILKKEYAAAAESFEKALLLPISKVQKVRLNFILGQLYTRLKNNEKARDSYKAVSKLNGPFEMQFNAKISSAYLGADDRVRKDLLRLLTDEKNSEYRDQIYYALAELSFQDKNLPETYENLKKCVFYSTSNKRQHAMGFERLARMSFADKNYINAQKYFDSCVTVMPEKFENETEIRSKALSLKSLVKAVEVAYYQDSILKIALMPEKKRKEFVQLVIKKKQLEQDKSTRDQRVKLAALQEKQLLAEQSTSGNKWYWNNAKSKTDGYLEFKNNWASRENTDDWRRSERIVSIDPMNTSLGNEPETSAKNVDSLSESFLMSKIPITQKQKETAYGLLFAAHYEAGILYRDLLNEIKLSNDHFTAILSKNMPSSFNTLAAFQLVKMYESKDPNRAAQYKSYIIDKYPDSDFAKYFKDPSYFDRLKQKSKLEGETFLSVLSLYNNGHFSQVISTCDLYIASKGALLVNYQLLKAQAMISLNVAKESVFELLNVIVSSNPNTSFSKKATELKELLEKGISTLEETPKEKESSVFTFTENDPQWVMIFLPESLSSNTEKNKLNEYNTELFPDLKLIVSSKLYKENQSVIFIKSFNVIEGKEYILKLLEDKKVSIDFASSPILLITQQNLKVLFENQNFEEYQNFYLELY